MNAASNATGTPGRGTPPAGAPMSRIIAGAAGGTPLASVPGIAHPAHHGPRQGGPVLPPGRLRGHCRRPGAGPLRRLGIAGRGECQPRRASRWIWWNPTPRPARSASGTRTWSTTCAPQGGLRAPFQGRILPGPDGGRRAAGTWSSSIRPIRWRSRRWPRCWPSSPASGGRRRRRGGALLTVPGTGWPDGLERFAEKKYGETRLWFAEPVWRKSPDDAPAQPERRA